MTPLCHAFPYAWSYLGVEEQTLSDDIVYQQSGTYPISITILEQGQVIATAAATATVGDLLEGRASSLTVAGFSDANPVPSDSYVVNIAWGDGTSTPGTVTGGNGQYTVQGTHAYKSAAAFAITVSVVDGSSSLSYTGSVLVADAPLTVIDANVNSIEGQTLSSVPVALITDANPYSTAADFTPTITWDDSPTSSSGAVSGSGPIFTVLASHLYANAGTYATGVIVSQVGGGTGVGRAKGPDGPAAKAFVKPNWNDATKYRLDLDVGQNGDLGSTLAGATPNGVQNYLPGDYGNIPAIYAFTQGGTPMLHPQKVDLYLAGLSETLAAAAGVARVDFQFATGPVPDFYMVTSLPGYAGNATSRAISVSPQVARNEADYSFAETTDRMQADPAKVTIGKNATTTTLFVKDYGGKATLWAQLIDKNGKILHTFALTVPVDKNHNGIADAWEIAQAKLLPNPPADPLDYFKDPNWDKNPFPNTTNTEADKNKATEFPVKLKNVVGDGLSLFYEYRGIVVEVGGFNRHVRLSPAVKNVLLDVDAVRAVTKALGGEKAAQATYRRWLDAVAQAYSQASYGAGVKLYYVIAPTPMLDWRFTLPAGTSQYKVTVLKSRMVGIVQLARQTVYHVPVHQFWRHLTIASTLDIPGIPDDFKKRLLDAQISGYSSTGQTPRNLRAGSFLFYRDAQTVFKEILTPKRMGEAPLKFDTFAAGVIIHELAHQLDSTDGHYPDSSGDRHDNQPDDFASVQFDYTQNPGLIPDYVYQDYYPLPGKTFRFGHAFLSGVGPFLVNMQLGAESFLPDP